MTEKQLQTEKLKLEFLNRLHETGGNVLRSCEIAGVSRATMLRHYEKDDQFRVKWDSAARDELKLEKVSNSDLTKPDLSEDENSTKLHIQNNIKKDRVDITMLQLETKKRRARDNAKTSDFDTNSEIEKASKRKHFSIENAAGIENDISEHSAESARFSKKETALVLDLARYFRRRD